MEGVIPQVVVVGGSGKLWMQGRVLGGVLVADATACLELQVKNHSTKKVCVSSVYSNSSTYSFFKNTTLTLSLTQILHLPTSSTTSAIFVFGP